MLKQGNSKCRASMRVTSEGERRRVDSTGVGDDGSGDKGVDMARTWVGRRSR